MSNVDVMRLNSRALSMEEVKAMEAVKMKGMELHDLLSEIKGSPREMALAKTNLEQAVMWAVKGITA